MAKGIKRHESLYPLSHHHHHALFLALNLRKIGTEKSKYSVKEMVEEVKTFWEPGGRQHFRDEEEILLPAYAVHESVDKAEIKEMLLEHVAIRALINQVVKTEEEENLVPLMNKLGRQLDDHIRKEERIVFPMIEEALSEQELNELSPYLHRD